MIYPVVKGEGTTLVFAKFRYIKIFFSHNKFVKGNKKLRTWNVTFLKIMKSKKPDAATMDDFSLLYTSFFYMLCYTKVDKIKYKNGGKL